MAKCIVCKLEMTLAAGCLASHIRCNGTRYERIKVGEEAVKTPYGDSERRCPDCNAKEGHYHHAGCDLEICPACGLQLANCNCADVCIKEEDVGE